MNGSVHLDFGKRSDPSRPAAQAGPVKNKRKELIEKNIQLKRINALN